MKEGMILSYSQDIKIFKTKFSKHDILQYYNDFYSMISDLNIKPIQLILHVALSSGETYDLSNIEDFKNEVHSSDKINSVVLIVLCGINDTCSIGLSSVLYFSTITFSSSNKSWVDDMTFKYKKHLHNQKIIITKNKKSVEEIAATTDYNNESWLKTHENLIIGVISILVTIIIAILGWTIFKK